MKYKILDKVELELQHKVTPRIISTLSDVGLLDEKLDFINGAIDISLSREKLLVLLKTIFVIGKKEEEVIVKNLEDIDLQVVMQGFADFFLRLNPSGKMLNDLNRILSF